MCTLITYRVYKYTRNVYHIYTVRWTFGHYIPTNKRRVTMTEWLCRSDNGERKFYTSDINAAEKIAGVFSNPIARDLFYGQFRRRRIAYPYIYLCTVVDIRSSKSHTYLPTSYKHSYTCYTWIIYPPYCAISDGILRVYSI